jgi:hypothetical protein
MLAPIESCLNFSKHLKNVQFQTESLGTLAISTYSTQILEVMMLRIIAAPAHHSSPEESLGVSARL